GDVVDGQRLAVGVPGADRGEQLRELAPEAVRRQRLVEMGVRLREGGQQDVAVEVEALLAARGDEACGYVRDEPVAEAHVRARAVVERCVSQEHGFLQGAVGGGALAPPPSAPCYLITYGTLNLPARIDAATCCSFCFAVGGICATEYFGLRTR